MLFVSLIISTLDQVVEYICPESELSLKFLWKVIILIILSGKLQVSLVIWYYNIQLAPSREGDMTFCATRDASCFPRRSRGKHDRRGLHKTSCRPDREGANCFVTTLPGSLHANITVRTSFFRTVNMIMI